MAVQARRHRGHSEESRPYGRENHISCPNAFSRTTRRRSQNDSRGGPDPVEVPIDGGDIHILNPPVSLPSDVDQVSVLTQRGKRSDSPTPWDRADLRVLRQLPSKTSSEEITHRLSPNRHSRRDGLLCGVDRLVDKPHDFGDRSTGTCREPPQRKRGDVRPRGSRMRSARRSGYSKFDEVRRMEHGGEEPGVDPYLRTKNEEFSSAYAVRRSNNDFVEVRAQLAIEHIARLKRGRRTSDTLGFACWSGQETTGGDMFEAQIDRVRPRPRSHGLHNPITQIRQANLPVLLHESVRNFRSVARNLAEAAVSSWMMVSY